MSPIAQSPVAKAVGYSLGPRKARRSMQEVHRSGRQRDADAAHQRLPVNLFGADGLYDGFAHSSRGQVL